MFFAQNVCHRSFKQNVKYGRGPPEKKAVFCNDFGPFLPYFRAKLPKSIVDLPEFSDKILIKIARIQGRFARIFITKLPEIGGGGCRPPLPPPRTPMLWRQGKRRICTTPPPLHRTVYSYQIFSPLPLWGFAPHGIVFTCLVSNHENLRPHYQNN